MSQKRTPATGGAAGAAIKDVSLGTEQSQIAEAAPKFQTKNRSRRQCPASPVSAMTREGLLRLPRELSIAIVKPWELLPLILADEPRGHYAAGMVEQGGHCATCAQRCNGYSSGFLFWAKSGRVQLAAMICAECAQQPDEWIATQNQRNLWTLRPSIRLRHTRKQIIALRPNRIGGIKINGF